MPPGDIRTVLDALYRALAHEPKGSWRTGLPIACASTRGLVRTENQDRIVVGRSPAGLVVAVLADGMGGMKDGARAASLAAGAVAAHCVTSPTLKLEVLLADALRFANDEVFRALHGEGGAALVVAAWSPAGRCVAHAGDARAYHLDGSGCPAQLTVDDTVKAQLKQLGRSSGEDSRPDSELLQFIGIGSGFEPHVSAVPSGGRGLLLTTDGVHSIPAGVFEWILKGAKHLQVLTERLIEASEWQGGNDNATALAISFLNSHGADVPVGNLEFWLPRDHLVMIYSPPGRPAIAEQPPRAVQRKSGKGTSRGQKKSRKKGPSGASPSAGPSERQLPIVTFDSASTKNAPPSETEGDTQPEESPTESEKTRGE